jgi:hypothetical protein
VRTNGALKVSVSAHPLLELPYGRYPRLLMASVTTEAVRTREPVLQLGPSLTSFMSELGLLPRGGQTGPIDLRVLKALRSPMAIDLYCWLTYRNSYLRTPCRIPWFALAAQLGADYRDGRNFKRKALGAIRQVLILYPCARVDQVRGGILLKPCPPRVRRRLNG